MRANSILSDAGAANLAIAIYEQAAIDMMDYILARQRLKDKIATLAEKGLAEGKDYKDAVYELSKIEAKIDTDEKFFKSGRFGIDGTNILYAVKKELAIADGYVDGFLESNMTRIKVNKKEIVENALRCVVRDRKDALNNLKIQRAKGEIFLCQKQKQ